MVYELPKLPYDYNSLEPFMDEATVIIHHTKHHQIYTDKLNAAIKGTQLESKNIIDVLSEPYSIPKELRAPVMNFGGGYVNHNLFWEILRPNPNPEANPNIPIGEAAEEINTNFGSFQQFKEKFSAEALSLFGSGWTWLAYNPLTKKLEIISTPNQDTPLMDGKSSLLTIDVWEHAYYLKYQNRRADFITAFWNIVNWDKVNELLQEATKK